MSIDTGKIYDTGEIISISVWTLASIYLFPGISHLLQLGIKEKNG
jgi:hypothetical protein